MTTTPLRSRAGAVARASATLLGDRRVIEIVIEGGEARGALTPEDSETLATAIRLATDQRLPVVCLLASSGVDVTSGLEGIQRWGAAARELARASGVVPTLFAACGPAVSGPALLLGLADQVVFTADAYAFVSGPRMVQDFTGVPVSVDLLGGAGAHARTSGLATLVVADREQARNVLAELLAFLPDHVDELPPRWPTDDPPDRPTPEAGDLIPAHPTGSYDVRDVIRAVADDGELFELRAQWAPNLVTAFVTLGGHPVGVVANQSQSLAGAIDIPASQKGARFVAFCDAFNMPLVTMVDTSGFLPGKDLEWRGMIRHGAQLAFAYARATVPRIGLTLRKSYGGAYIVMDSRHMGNDLMLAWPSAEVAVMGAKGAVEILHRRVDAEERLRLEAAYEARFLTPYPAAERGSIAMVIDPADTRRELVAAVELLSTKRERLRPRRHDNSPL
jgi:acetyl-CoA carboxylase carboxyltransferase component